MPDVSPPEIDRHNQQTLEELCRLLRFSQGEFELILAVCNSTQQRQGLVQQLRQQCSVAFAEITLEPSTTTLFTTIRSAIGSPPPEALMVYGLDGVQDQQPLLTATNQIREEFRQFPFPLVLWLTDDGLKQLIRTAPDFYTWANSVTFATPPEFFLSFLDQLIADVWQQVMDSRENRFLSNQELGLTPGSARCRELDTSLEVLTAQGIAPTPEQSAGLAFVQGRIADNNTPAAREHYEHSLAQWQALVDHNPSAEAAATWQEKIGHGQFYLGLWWRNYSVRHRREFEPACQQACRYFEQAVQTFETLQRPDLAARYINYWAEALHRLSAWEALETVATRARLLHQAQADPIRQARAEGFLAEVDLAYENYVAAQRRAEAALALIQPLADSHAAASAADRDFYAWVNSFHRSWYVFSLGKAQMGQGQVESAVQTLEQVQRITQPEYDPQLYGQMLECLRQGYFDQGHYLQAFETRRQKEAIESRFNFRAFVGAGRLQPKRQITNPALPTGDHGLDLIMASGRTQDVQRLMTRLEQDEFVLTVVYGPSGVGKSSLIEAGLVPTLEQQRFGGRQVIPVRLRNYGNWAADVLTSLPDQKGVEVDTTQASADTLAQNLEELLLDLLREQTQANRVIVLIFDQFEEFFFECNQTTDRLRFYSFLGKCLAMPFIKVVLSLREDYTHYLLECNRLTDLAIIDNNILDKKWLYYLGNFSPAEAKIVINDLTEPTPYVPTPDLIDQVVADLAANAGEVRPIEVQIVGAQLQAEDITTLAEYQARGTDSSSTKVVLVEHYLNDVVTQCGTESNQRLAALVLFLLTDEKGTRPLKTKVNLIHDLNAVTDQTALEDKTFDLVLQILTKSGLVMQELVDPDDRYQIVHDYLAAFIRSQQQPLMAQLNEERQLRIEAEQRMGEEQQKRIRHTRMAAVGLGALAVISTATGAFAWVQQRTARSGEVNAQILAGSLEMENYLEAGLEEAAVIQAMRTGQALQSKNATRLETDTRFRATSSIREVIYGVRERNRLIGHSDGVSSVAFSPDGQTLATASADKTVKLWSKDGEELQTLNGHSDWVNSVAFSPDGQTLATASDDKTVKLWSKDGEELRTLKGHGDWIWKVVFSPDGQTLATASDDKTVKLWTKDGKELRTLKGHDIGVYSVAFSPDGQTLATASDDKTIKLWSKDGEELQTLRGHSEAVIDVVFSADGQTLATASADKTVKLWSKDGKELQTLKGHSAGVSSMAFSPDGQTIATAADDQTVKLWDTSGVEQQTLKGHSSGVESVVFSPDGETLASASADNTVKLWSENGEASQTFGGHSGEVYNVVFSLDGKMLATASSDQTIKLWTKNGQELQTLKASIDWSSDLAFSPDGKTLASANADQTVRLWSKDGKELQVLKGHTIRASAVVFSPNGETIATAGADKTVKLWSKDGEELRTLKGHTNWVVDITFSPDGQTLASAGADKTVKLWSKDGEELRTIKGHTNWVNTVAFSPDGQTLASAGSDQTVRLWSKDGEELKTLKGHTNRVNEVTFSPDGQTLASAGADKMVKLWSKDGEELQTLKGHNDGVTSLVFSPDGQTLATASSDQTVKLWSFQLDDLLAKGCEWLSIYFVKQTPELLAELKVCQQQNPDWMPAAALTLVTQAENLAREGNINQAIELFNQAISWDSSLDINAKTKAEKLAKSQTLVDEAKDLAKAGQLAEATARLTEAKKLDPSLDFESEIHAKELALQGYLDNGRDFLNEGKVSEAVAAYRRAEALNLEDGVLASDWYYLCWIGSTYDQAEAVIFACNKAVALLPSYGWFIDSRGLARALTGDTQGAIADFQAGIEWITDQDLKAQRQGWIEDLKQGKNPFTPEVLEDIRYQ